MIITDFAQAMVERIQSIIMLQHLIPANDHPEKIAGYFTLFNVNLGYPELIIAVGLIPEEKKKKYFELSLEKAERLFQHPEHVSSFQSRDGINKWGGAIRVKWVEEDEEKTYEYILSFSGLTEAMDETSMLDSAESLGVIDDDVLDTIVSISDNACYRQFKALEE